MPPDTPVCKTCTWGNGLWAYGEPVGVGPLEAEAGAPTIPCPECGGCKNPRQEDKP